MKTAIVFLLSPGCVLAFSPTFGPVKPIQVGSTSAEFTKRTVALHASSVLEDIGTPEGQILDGVDSTKNSIYKADDKKTYLDDGFVFGLDGSGLDRPKGKVAQIVVEGDSLETQPYQVAAVAFTLMGHAGFAATSLMQMLETNGGNLILTTLQAVTLLITSWILADFGSGVLHWSVDNYGNGRTPVMGSIIAAFQGHHSAPWTITERGFCNNVYKLCVPFGLPTMAILSFLTGPFTTFFLTIFCVMEILSQEFHKWSHQTPNESPAFANFLQSVGLSIARKPHALHHIAPYEGNYCIISGICNPILDKSGIFRRLEHLIYKLNGIESNAWKLDAKLRERTLRGDYGLPTVE